MPVTYIDALSSREGLELHENLSGFTGQGSTSILLLTEGSQRKVAFLGAMHKDTSELTAHINSAMEEAGPTEFIGIAGKHILSCHFRGSAYAQFREKLEVLDQNAFTIQISGRDEYFQQAVVRWGNLKNKEIAGASQAAGQMIRLEPVAERPGAFNLVLPSFDHVKEFDFRLKRGFFEVEARQLMHNAAGVKLSQP